MRLAHGRFQMNLSAIRLVLAVIFLVTLFLGWSNPSQEMIMLGVFLCLALIIASAAEEQWLLTALWFVNFVLQLLKLELFF